MAEPNVFMLKHRYLWEQQKGKLQTGEILVCRSTDKANTDPSNWELIDRKEHLKRNYNHKKHAITMKALWKSEKIRASYGMTRKPKLRIK